MKTVDDDTYFANVIGRADASINDAMELLPATTVDESRGYLVCGGNKRNFYFHMTGDVGGIKKYLVDRLGHDESTLGFFKSIVRQAEDVLKEYKSQFTQEEWEEWEGLQ